MNRMIVLLSVASLGCAIPAEAQVFGRKPPPPAADPSQIDCAALARMPNAPMTQQTCEAMMQQAGAMQGAMTSGAGARPGDAAMSCADIKEEIATQTNVGVSKEHVAEGQSASADYIAKQKKIDAEGKAMMAQQTATLVGAAAVSSVPVVGNAAAMAAGRANAASSEAFAAHASAELTPARQRMMASTTSSLGDVTQSMQDNPRFGRLAGLMQEKNCR